MSACERPERRVVPDSADTSAPQDSALRVVSELGRRLRNVPLLAPREQVIEAIRSHYAGLVAPALLDRWTRDPGQAPGRPTSSPWPDRIEVQRVERRPGAEFLVTGHVIEVTSAEIARGGGAASRTPVRVVVRRLEGGWRITEYQEGRSAAGGESGEADSPAAAAVVVHEYYRAIDERRYRDAYELWGSEGAASGKSFEEFRDGFAETATVAAEVGSPGPMGAAAGSRYVEVPVRIVAWTREGARQEFEGKYTLRRSVVDGATPAQRAWHLYSAEIRRSR